MSCTLNEQIESKFHYINSERRKIFTFSVNSICSLELQSFAILKSPLSTIFSAWIYITSGNFME